MLLLLTLCVAALADTLDVEFRYHGVAQAVQVAGTFNGWRAVDTLRHRGDMWSLTKPLAEGYYEYKLVVDGRWLTDPANPKQILDGLGGYNSLLKVGEPLAPMREHRAEPLPREKLPRPILAAHPDWIELYWAAWQMAWDKIAHGTPHNGFAAAYMDEGFNEQIYQWDSCFMTLFAVYGRDAFPVMASLDNFYAKQRADGYIQRVYDERTGAEVAEPTADEPLVNPPLFAWAEWKFYSLAGDSSRIRRVLPVLTRYFDWIQTNLRAEGSEWLVYNSMLGSGMDNTPRPGLGHGAWIDFSAQQAFAATCLSRLAEAVGDHETASAFTQRHHEIADEISAKCWSEDDAFYFDRRPDGTLTGVRHIGAYWTYLAGVSDAAASEGLEGALTNPAEFWRPHPVPTLAASDSNYDPRGHYWLGSVWAPTNYMVVQSGCAGDSTRVLAERHLAMMAEVFAAGVPDSERVPFDQRYADGYHTIWECYSPECAEPATRWDNTFYSRQDFVGWSGLGPIAMLIETVLGIEVHGATNAIYWHPRDDSRNGIEHLKLREQYVDLIYDPATKQASVKAEAPFRLTVYRGDQARQFEIQAGETTLDVK